MTRSAILGLALALGITDAALGSPAPARPVETAVERTPVRPMPASRAETASYAEREQQDRQVANYQGGEGLVMAVSGSAVLAVMLALVLI